MHTGGREGERERGGGTSCTPTKDFKNLDHKNAIKHENMRPPGFFHHPVYPLKRI
jgi:hypothetical protein